MRNISKKPTKWFGTLIALLSFFFVGAGIVAVAGQADAQSQSPQPSAGERLITLHDTGHERGLLTNAGTLRQALEEANIPVDPNDMIEPGLDDPLVANSYEVNIYRARPVTVIDGAIRQRVMSPHQTAKQIAAHAGIILQDEDTATLDASTDMVSEGAGIQLKIDRAVEFTFVLYGKKMTAYTQAATAAEMLAQKQIIIGASDTLSVPLSTPMTKGMTIELWRNGKQTVTEEKDMPFTVEKVKDMDREVGYREVKTPGEAGKRTVIYEVDMRNGQEVSRAEIQSTVTKEPKKQVEIVGAKAKPGNGLTKAKGVVNFTDSQGITHRETYYDLPMKGVMSYCRGTYSVRGDGVKVDQDGYIIIAANLTRYPRCSVVETSLGSGKVYDTGGFASVHPDGFDLATDWSNNDGI